MPAASAHSIYTRDIIGSTGNFCLQGTAENNHFNANGLTYGWGMARAQTSAADPSWAPCWQRPAVYVNHALAGFAYYWDLSAGQWSPCFGSDWLIRSSATGSERYWYMNDANYGCGSTFYMFYGGVAARHGDNDAWVGQWMMAGRCCNPGDEFYHWFDQLPRGAV